MKLPTAEPGRSAIPLGERIAAKLHAAGIPLPERPDAVIPDLPPDLTNVSSRNLGELATRIGAWAAYLAPQIIIAKGDAADLRNQVDWARKIDKDERRAQEIQRLQTEKAVEADLIEALYKSILRKKETVSREIARIEGDAPRPHVPAEQAPPTWTGGGHAAASPPPWAANTQGRRT